MKITQHTWRIIIVCIIVAVFSASVFVYYSFIKSSPNENIPDIIENVTPPVQFVNTWVFLDEDEPPGTTYLSSNSCWQTIPWNKTDKLFVAWGHVDTSEGFNKPSFILYECERSNNLTNYDYLNFTIKEARAANPDIQILIELGWTYADYNNFIQCNVSAFAQSVCEFIETYGLDGFSWDYEYPWTGNGQALSTSANPQYKAFLQSLRNQLTTLEAKTSKDYLIYLSPAGFGGLDADTINQYVDGLNVQMYYSTVLWGYVKGKVSDNKLGYGAKFEATPDAQPPSTYYQTVFQAAKNAGATFITTWRMNSGNFEYEQDQQSKLYDLVHS